MIVRNSNGKARKGKVGDGVVMSLVDSGAFAVMGSIGLRTWCSVVYMMIWYQL